ncbi:hypothetical protein [Thalassospira lucentensis]|uniref:hypothetical protein n=1 Tax=Thalassospira lucentensis TaxID=168935 RepID=UPI00142D9B67|nr:hypothetical protein [Thalassospira lucentensis]NIZ03226.1 hypothetical protein [Thalassospira lucentensis]
MSAANPIPKKHHPSPPIRPNNHITEIFWADMSGAVDPYFSAAVGFLGSGTIHLIRMAGVIFVKSKEKPAGRVGTPHKGFNAGVCKYNACPSD